MINNKIRKIYKHQVTKVVIIKKYKISFKNLN